MPGGGGPSAIHCRPVRGQVQVPAPRQRFGEIAAADPVATLDDLIAGLPDDRRLHETLKELGRLGEVSTADAARLSAAREARNFIAHQGALFDIYQRPSGRLREAMAGKRTYDLNHDHHPGAARGTGERPRLSCARIHRYCQQSTSKGKALD
jgi:hypothetical protein